MSDRTMEMSSEKSDEAVEAIRRHARLFDIHTQAVIATTQNGDIVYWSDTASRMYGWTANEVLGRNVVEVTPSNLTRHEATEIMEQLKQGRGWSGDFVVQRRNGTEFRAHVRDIPVHDNTGAFVGIVGVSTPV